MKSKSPESVEPPAAAATLVLPHETAVGASGIPDALRAVEASSAFVREVNLEVDARQLHCPLPLLKARQGLRNLAAGDLLRVLATDAGSLKDFVSFAQLTGQGLEAFAMDAGVYCYLIRKA